MDVRYFTKDSKMADEGVWISGLPGMFDMKLKVRASNSRLVREALTNAAIALSGESDEQATRLARADVIADAVLLDWDNITDGSETEGGVEIPKKIPYDKELARSWLRNPDTSEFLDLVDSASLQASTMTRKGVKALEGN